MHSFRTRLAQSFRLAAVISLILSTLLFLAIAFYSRQIPQQFFVLPGEELTFSSMSALQSGSPVTYDKTALADSAIGTDETVTVRLFGLIPVVQTHVQVQEEQFLAVGGSLFGIKLFTEGVMVIDTGTVETASGAVSPADAAGIRKGDIILSVNGKAITSNESLAACIKQAQNGAIIRFRRDEKLCSTVLTPARSHVDGSYKGGLWVRDSTAGLGTITYYDPESGAFGGLGHGIRDSDTNLLMPLSDGQICRVQLNGIVKGRIGTAGELRGSFASNEVYGSLEKNTDSGVFGTLVPDFIADSTTLAVMHKQNVQLGAAVIRCTLDNGDVEEYDIRIDRIDLNEHSPTQNMAITVTDEDLLEKTGGIVQGMSGSPIIQNGKLVGAVTHVLVNDPTRGYGILIENMLDAAG